MKEIKRPDRVKDSAEYFIRRHGGWFRPNAAGYTDDIAQAGLYSADAARSFMKAEGVTVVPLNQAMRNVIWKEMRGLVDRAAKLAAMATR